MKKNKIVAIIMASALAIGSISVFADTSVEKGKHESKRFTEKVTHADMFREFLSTMLEEGKITQEEYDAQIAKIESVKTGPGFGFGRYRANGFGRGNNFEKKRNFEKKELTEEEKAQLQNKHKEKLAKMLEEGKITQEQYDEQLKKIENGEFVPGFGRGNGFAKGNRNAFVRENRKHKENNTADSVGVSK